MLRYAVMRFGDEWRVVSERRRIGRFASRDLAIMAGARLAREAMATGHPVELLVQDGAGCLLAYDVMHLAAHLDERLGSTAAPADEGPPQPGVRALEF